MMRKQARLIATSGYDADDFVATSEGWSHNGYVAWQLEAADESKGGESEDGEIAAILRQLDDME